MGKKWSDSKIFRRPVRILQTCRKLRFNWQVSLVEDDTILFFSSCLSLVSHGSARAVLDSVLFEHTELFRWYYTGICNTWWSFLSLDPKVFTCSNIYIGKIKYHYTPCFCISSPIRFLTESLWWYFMLFCWSAFHVIPICHVVFFHLVMMHVSYCIVVFGESCHHILRGFPWIW